MATGWTVNADLVKGEDLFLYLAEDNSGNTSGNCKVLAYATSCSLQIDREVIDTSSKFSHRWNAVLGGKNSYTISSDALYCKASSASANSAITFDGLEQMMVDQDNVNWYMGYPNNPTNGDYSLKTLMYSGKAVVTSLSLEAGNNEIATCSITLTGSEKINKAN